MGGFIYEYKLLERKPFVAILDTMLIFKRIAGMERRRF